MNFFKRATTSILRRPGKTIILLLLVFILGSVIAGAISVEGAISNTDANLRARMPAIVTTRMDWESIQESVQDLTFDEQDEYWRQLEELTVDQVRALGALEYVEVYDYMQRSWMQTFDLERHLPEPMLDWGVGWPGEPVDFSLFGGNNPSPIHLENDLITLVQGRVFSDSELSMGANPNRSVAIVSQSFADLNNLSLNSTFNLSHMISYPNEYGGWWMGDWTDQWLDENIYTTIEIEVEIVGLFELNEEFDYTDHSIDWWPIMQRMNAIYVPNWVIGELDRQRLQAEISSWDAVDFDFDPEVHWRPEEPDEDQEESITPVFMLKNPAYIDDFRIAAEDILPPYFILIDMSGGFGDIESSMATMQSIANWILWVSVGATLLILSLLITLFLRDRRYEMGVYLALGEKKGRIILQILMEVVVTALVGITFAVFVGNMISSVMSQNMLETQLLAPQDDDPWGGGGWTWDPDRDAFEQIGIPRTEMTPQQMVDAFQITLSFEVILLFYAIGLGAVVLSTMVPVLYVVTLNPKKVLM